MINQVLAQVDNRSTPPADWSWPVFTPVVFSDPVEAIRGRMIGRHLARETHFLRSLELVWFLGSGPLGGLLTVLDSRITYTIDDVNARLSAGGTAIQYTGPVSTVPTVTLLGGDLLTADLAISVEIPIANQAAITDPQGNVTVVPFTWNSGTLLSSPVQIPGVSAQLLFSGAVPQAGQSWVVNYRNPSVGWIERALALQTRDDLATLNTPTTRQYLNSPVALDRLAALVAGLAGL